MLEYLDYSTDWDDPGVVSLHDELPLWSAPFGLMLLDQVKLRPGMTVLDIGFGTGFPLIELAQRLGNSSTVYGIDPWTAAIERTRSKIKFFKIKNVKLVAGELCRPGSRARKVEAGKFEIPVGASLTDIRLKGRLIVK